ncbi:MAG: zinc ribbon domain-containing protein [Acholeplasmataceae bacterium]|nr:zinc ribbon domain-containing protein [Acholeplasmataceae bacterium]
MYCKNCGKPLNEDEKFCAQCGTAKSEASFGESIEKTCQMCGKPLNPNSAFCSNCGSAARPVQVRPLETAEYSSKNRLVAGLLGLFLGGLGIHNFYLGHTKKGITKIVLFALSLAFFIFGGVMVANSGYTDISTGEFFITNHGDFTVGIGLIVFGYLISIGVGIWAFVESILIFVSSNIKDSDNKPLKKL